MRKRSGLWRILLQARCEELGHPGHRYGKVVIGSGHMIDTPDRETPRFTPEMEAAVRAAIAQRLEQWTIGRGDLAVCGGARGADILFAEECERRGSSVRLLIAKELDAFVERSVRLPGSDWSARFHALCERSTVAIQPERLGQPPADVSPYARNNRWISSIPHAPKEKAANGFTRSSSGTSARVKARAARRTLPSSPVLTPGVWKSSIPSLSGKNLLCHPREYA